MKNIAFVLLFFLLVSGHSNANSVGGSIGGWNVVSNVANGIGAKITATKEVMINGASKVVTGTANITPKFTDVGRFMGRVGAAAVVTEAVNQILDGVDWVLDPANNSINTYKKVSDEDKQAIENENSKYTSKYQYTESYYSEFHTAYSLTAICSWYVSKTGGSNLVVYDTSCTYKAPNNPNLQGIVPQRSSNPHYNPSYIPIPIPQNESKTVPISDVASQVITQAESDIRSGNPASPAVALTRAVAQDMAVEAETDDVKARPIANQFEQTQAIPTDEDATGTIDTPEVVDPVTGEVVKPAETSSIAMKFPKACDWFPQACLFIDWAMTDPNVDSDMEVPEKEIEKQEIKKDLVKISGRSCPSDVKFDVDGLPFGIKINKAYSMQEICNTVEPLKYVFELITAVICALILLRV
ncbi:hypothetical protein N5B99_12250 [Acinetobacter johnsonii]|uniref:hypothetical protein n=1 Tax=Acinetobacter johnsonii TaxID=40214 RepID=UPI0024496BE4|nr:hypothetical protein [Acinetobacter johnsonii]MDH1241418.1 hypothetical protein [Acinetobacter johnsonii]